MKIRSKLNYSIYFLFSIFRGTCNFLSLISAEWFFSLLPICLLAENVSSIVGPLPSFSDFVCVGFSYPLAEFVPEYVSSINQPIIFNRYLRIRRASTVHKFKYCRPPTLEGVVLVSGFPSISVFLGLFSLKFPG